MTETSRKIAKDLLKIQAVFLSPDKPFTWASGIKSPVYCDNRLTLTAPEVRTDVETGLKELIEENYPEAEVLMGTSTAGIAHAERSLFFVDWSVTASALMKSSPLSQRPYTEKP